MKRGILSFHKDIYKNKYNSVKRSSPRKDIRSEYIITKRGKKNNEVWVKRRAK